VRTWLGVLLAIMTLAAGAAAQEESFDPAQVVGPPRGPRLEGAALEARADDIAALLRCPVCQGLSVADSPSTMASNMRGQVKELVAAGYDEDQILAYFERSYGEFVRLRPPLRGVNWVVWLAPVMGLLLGAVVIVWALRAPRPAATGAPIDAEAKGPAGDAPGPDTLPADRALARYVLRVRERAYGWPGGVSPSAQVNSSGAPAVPASGDGV
jgi:cytochrome c-type biogenesis protein CcmH